METLVLRTRPAQWTTLFKQHTNSRLFPIQSPTAISRCSQSFIYQNTTRRTITDSPQLSQQAAVRRREQDDSEDDAHPPQQQLPQSDPKSILPPSGEPDQRATLSARHLREPPPRAQPTRHNDSIAFLNRARTTTPGAASPSLSTSQAVQTDRYTQYDFLEKNPDASFLTPRGLRSRPQPGQTGPDVVGQQAATASGASRTGASSLNDLLQKIRSGSPAGGVGTGIRRGLPTRLGAATSPTGPVDTSRMQLSRNPAYEAQARANDPIGNFLGGTGLAMSPQANADLLAPSFRISPSLGRTQAVNADKGMDVARAFRSVDIRCSVNMVRADSNKQRFHERGGIKRKRLAMSRWRRRFKEGFRATVRRVEDMRRKGW